MITEKRLLVKFDDTRNALWNLAFDHTRGIVSKKAYREKKSYYEGVLDTIRLALETGGRFINSDSGVSFMDSIDNKK